MIEKIMKTLIVTPESEKDLKFLKTLLKKLGYRVQELSEEELEDTVLLHAMVSEKKEDYVSEEEISDALK